MASFTTNHKLQNDTLTLTFIFNIKSQDNKTIQRQSECTITPPNNLTITANQAQQIEKLYTREYCIHAAMMLETHSMNYSYNEYMAALKATPPQALSTAKISQQNLQNLNIHAQNAHRGALKSELETNKLITGASRLAVTTELEYTI